MKIRSEQMRALEVSAVRNFEIRMVRHIRSFSAEDLGDFRGESEVQSFVQTSIAQAIAYGCRTEREIARYVQLAVPLGSNFPQSKEYPWIPDIMSDLGVSLEDKLRQVFERLVR